MVEQTLSILHILRSAPDDGTQKMMDELSTDGQTDLIKLFDADVDWDGVIDSIFSHNRVVCWW